MPSTTLLVRSHVGWHEITDAAGDAVYGRKEALLSEGAQQTRDEALRLASRELAATFARVQERTTVEHRVADLDEAPYATYQPGDRITAPNFVGSPTVYRVQALMISQDDRNGLVSVVATIGDQILGVEFESEVLARQATEKRIGQDIRKMIPGTFAGRARSATPVDPSLPASTLVPAVVSPPCA